LHILLSLLTESQVDVSERFLSELCDR